MLYTIRKIPILLFILWSLSAQAQSSDISEVSNTGTVPEEKNAAFTINLGLGNNLYIVQNLQSYKMSDNGYDRSPYGNPFQQNKYKV